MTAPILEPDLIRESGLTQQTLRNLRRGHRKGQYTYPPVLLEGSHWYRVGRTVVYTDEGRAEVMRRARKPMPEPG